MYQQFRRAGKPAGKRTAKRTGIRTGKRTSKRLLALALLSACCAVRIASAAISTAANDAAPIAADAAGSACVAAPFGADTLYLRGSMSTWAARPELAFHYQCNAYLLDLELLGRQDFKVADAAFSPARTIGAAPGQQTEVAHDGRPYAAVSGDGVANLSAFFAGAYTVRLSFSGAGAPLLSISERPAGAAAGTPANPVAASLLHDSRDLASKAPFGAAPAGSTLHFALAAMPGVSAATLVIEQRRLEGNQDPLDYRPLARIALQRETGKVDGEGSGNGAAAERWSGDYRFPAIGVFGYYFEVSIGGQTYVYQNNAQPVYWTREAGSNGRGVAAALPADSAAIRRFRQTIYAPDFRVPDWARDAVYYYIFPDRFRNGSAANDQQPGADPVRGDTRVFHKNWLDRPDRPATGRDFFGGDLQGVIDKLDYIAALGANTLYLTPVFEAASNHKYDTADYRNIDSNYGSNADYQRLTAEAARRGLRVIVDASFNHTGADSIYFDRYARYGGAGAFGGGRINPGSPYADWYSFTPGAGAPDQQYRGWLGVSNLPELNKASPGFRAFAYGDPDSVTELWLQRGASGWRMDVAPWVPDDFWHGWRAALKARHPDALTIAETWFDASKFLLGDSFDSTMNYVLRNAVLDYAAGIPANAVYPNIELLREAYPPQAFYALMNVLSTHDLPRALYHLGYQSADADAATVALAKQRLRLAVLFQMTFPGAPTVYYGDEVGVTGGDDPDNRAPYPWADLGGRPDQATLEEFKAMIKLRRDYPVLRHGSLAAPALLDRHVIALVRQDGAQWALTLTNNAQVAQEVEVPLPPALRAAFLTDVQSGARLPVENGKVKLSVPALYGRILVSQPVGQ